MFLSLNYAAWKERQKSNVHLNSDHEHEEFSINSAPNELDSKLDCKMAPLDDKLDRRLRQHSEQINDLSVKLFGVLKKELGEMNTLICDAPSFVFVPIQS